MTLRIHPTTHFLRFSRLFQILPFACHVCIRVMTHPILLCRSIHQKALRESHVREMPSSLPILFMMKGVPGLRPGSLSKFERCSARAAMTVPAPLLDMFQRDLCAYALRVGDKDFLFNPTEN